MTVKADMAKCVGAQFDITEEDLVGNIRHGGEDSSGDLHLNKEEAIEIAFLVIKRIRR